MMLDLPLLGSGSGSLLGSGSLFGSKVDKFQRIMNIKRKETYKIYLPGSGSLFGSGSLLGSGADPFKYIN